MAWYPLLLPAPTADAYSSPKPRLKKPTHPSTHLGYVGLGVRPQCGQLETTQAATLKSGSSWTLLQFLNLPGCGENCIRKFSRHTPRQTTQAVTLKSGSSMTLLQFLNLPGFGGNYIRKFSCFSVRVGAWCTGLPAGLL
jgi:hypothetical protein